MDIQQLFETQFEQMRKQDQAKYFLMRVERVDMAKENPDAFRAIGVRVDNGQKVAVFSTKSTSGQHIPEKGGILRADKVSRIGAKSTEQLTAYSAEYFHAYRNDDFCIRAIAQAQRPKKDRENGMWSADMRFFDVESAPAMLDGAELAQKLEGELLRLLKPWSFAEDSSITHDVQGNSLWGNAQPRPGFSPFVAVRSGNKTFYVYGDGGVRQKSGREDEKVYALPTDDQLRARIQKNTGVQNLLSIMNSIKGQATPEQLKQLKVTLIPGLQVRVGRDSLGGEKQSYLAVPDAFDWKRQDILDDKGNPATQPGYRLADVHIKLSRNGSMLIVDAAPSAGGRLTQFIPETRVERELRVAAEEQKTAAPQATTAAQSKPAQRAEPAKAAPRQQPAQRQEASRTPDYDMPAPNSFDDQVPDDFGDFDTYAEDLASMQNQEPSYGNPDEEDLDSLLEEASQRQRSRGHRPTM